MRKRNRAVHDLDEKVPPTQTESGGLQERLEELCVNVELAISGLDLVLTRELSSTQMYAPCLAPELVAHDMNYDLVDAAIQTESYAETIYVQPVALTPVRCSYGWEG